MRSCLGKYKNLSDEQLIIEINKRLDYIQDKGELRRKPGFTGTVAGALVGTVDSNGKLQGAFLGKRYQVDRLIWLIETGHFPEGVIYHKNDINLDNKYSNLSDITRHERAMLSDYVLNQISLSKYNKKINRLNRIIKLERQKAETKRNRFVNDAEYRNNNRGIYRKAQKDYYNKNKTNPDYISKRACRQILNRVISDCKTGRCLSSGTEMHHGYSYVEFKEHIESLFESWMTWENHGEWHVDHRKPVSLFIKKGIKDPLVINALENLRPIPARANLVKGNRYVA